MRALGLAISAASLAGVVWWAARQPAPELPASAAELWALAGALCAYGLATALRAERWRALLRAEGGTPGRGDCYGLTAVGFMGNNALPARAGDAMRVYLMAPRSGLRMREVVGTLIAERVLDVAVLLGLFALLAYGLLRGIATPVGSVPAAAAIALGAAALAGAALLLVVRSTARGRRAAELLRPLLAPTARLGSGRGARIAALTGAVWASEAATYLLVGHSVGVALAPLEALYLIAVAGVFVLVPSGPGYAGTLDAAVLFGLGAVGVAGGAAVSFLIMLRFVLLVPLTAAGAVLLVARYGGLRAEREAVAEAAR